MNIVNEVNDAIKQYREDYKDAGAGYQNYSRVLKRQIPGKTQVKTIFIDELQELRCLAVGMSDNKAKDMIDALLKGYM
tara:strand:- start:278 stop:511 length:234 start_codon:yes stop_codon:yes gene_type:complete